MTTARIYDSWEEQQAATKKVAALARRSNPDDLLSELLPARSSQRANAATVMQEAIARESFTKMTIEFVWCEASWKRGHASNILAARSMFPTVCVRSAHANHTKLHHATSLPLTHHHPTPVACKAGRAAPHGDVRPHL